MNTYNIFRKHSSDNNESIIAENISWGKAQAQIANIGRDWQTQELGEVEHDSNGITLTAETYSIVVWIAESEPSGGRGRSVYINDQSVIDLDFFGSFNWNNFDRFDTVWLEDCDVTPYIQAIVARIEPAAVYLTAARVESNIKNIWK